MKIKKSVLRKTSQVRSAGLIGTRGIQRVKKQLYKEVDKYIKTLMPESTDADERFFVRDFAKHLTAELKK
jgi:DNA replication initiation complex subunit (GINS family)